MMVTSRDTRRWLIPKGNPIRGLQPHSAAAQEAFEEAGVAGVPCPIALGSYCYWKRRSDGRFNQAIVQVFPLSVLLQAEEWPESKERERRWFPAAEAAEVVEEAGLSALILSFRPEPADTGAAARALRWTRQTVSDRFPGPGWPRGLLGGRP